MKLTVVIPVYNEENTFLELFRQVVSEKHQKEIIIIDDFSTDGTRDILKSLPQDDHLKIIFFNKNMGKGAAIREGFKHATGDIVIIQDADLEYYPDEYENLIKPIVDKKADVVYGSRFLGAHSVHFFWHFLGNKIINLINNIILNTFLTDMMTCYKAFRLPVLQSLELKANRFGIEPEITAEVFRRGYKVYEVPISYNGRGYEDGKKIKCVDFFKCVYWLLRANYRIQNISHDTLIKMKQMKNNNEWVFKKIKPYIGQNTLELGSGVGTFSNLFAKESKHLLISDINDDNINILKQKFIGNRRITIKKLDAAKVNEHVDAESFDTVIAVNMLEHIENDVSVLSGVYKVLTKHGKLILLLPAHKWLYGTLDKEIGHYRRYSKDELQQKLTQSGYLIDKIEFINMFSTFGWYLNFKILKKKIMPPSMLGIVDLLIPVFQIFENLIKPPFGLSLFVVAKKR